MRNPTPTEINNQYSALLSPEAPTRALFQTLIQSGQYPTSHGELSIVFVDDATIAQIHDDFMWTIPRRPM